MEVYGDDPEMSIGFPTGDVFSFDDILFQQLCSAFADGDTSGLNRLWERAERFEAELIS